MTAARAESDLEPEQQEGPTSWTLHKEDCGSVCNSSASGSSSSGCEENHGVFLIVNGKRARSKKSGTVYGHLSRVKRMNDKFRLKTSDGSFLSMSVDDLDTQSLVKGLGMDVSVANLEESLHPLLHSTPNPNRRRESTYQGRKRQRTVVDTADPHMKYKGCFEVPLSQIRRASPAFTLIEGNAAKVEMFKAELKTIPNHHIPVLPVMVQDENWDGSNVEDADYFLLGGYNLWEAIVDLSDDERFSHYRRCTVKVYSGLDETHALEVGAVFQQQQMLLRDDVPELQAKVGICRRLLYAMHGLDEDVDEPPSTVREEWRKRAAAALGSIATTSDGRKPLEATFQLALYSRRCYAKLVRLFSINLEKTGKPLKQTVLMHLQGMKEPQRFSLLTRMVGGDLQVNEVKGEAQKIKGLSRLRNTFQTLTRMKTWEDCMDRYPVHTQDSVLAQFLGKDMRKSIPQEFIEFIQEAEQTVEGSFTSMEELRTSPVALTVLEVQSTSRMKGQLKKLKEGTNQLAILTDQLEVAAAWQSEMKKQGFNHMAEAIVIEDMNAQHLIVGGEQQHNLSLPKVIPERNCFHTLLEIYTNPKDQVVGAVHNQGTLDEEARSMERVCTKLWFSGDVSRQEQPTTSSSDDYEFI